MLIRLSFAAQAPPFTDCEEFRSTSCADVCVSALKTTRQGWRASFALTIVEIIANLALFAPVLKTHIRFTTIDHFAARALAIRNEKSFETLAAARTIAVYAQGVLWLTWQARLVNCIVAAVARVASCSIRALVAEWINEITTWFADRVFTKVITHASLLCECEVAE
jgi:hypothetical protein